ncbi:MAG TPA: PAS domain-containing sensor histidine kinase [Ignavibacteriaceae bacterium]|nr:PAS domain-containing sensor histidine kinase [Ignavibacteriaceae bacterium]
MKRTPKDKSDKVILLKKEKKKKQSIPKKLSSDQFDNVQRLVYLLQVHQVELEHQNEELRIAQEELEQSRNKYVNLFDFSPIPYFTLDPQGIIQEVNLSASKMIGIERKKLIGKNFITYVPFYERDLFQSFLLTVFSTSVKHSRELKITGKNKKVYNVLLDGLKLEDFIAHGQYCQVALIDLTEYKRIEESLKRSNEELQVLNIAKDKFFSIIAHDLRNPFHSLLGFSEILASEIETLSNEEIATFSKGLNDDLRNIYGLLDNLLQWSMIQRNMLDYNPIKLDLHNLVNKMIAISNKMAEEKNITIYNNIANGTFVYADTDMLRSIIQNLLINAIKFTRQKGNIVFSSVEKGNLIEVSVEDSGTGIESKAISNLFSFDRILSNSGTSGERGTGLGLPLCKEFVERNYGKIWVESEPGKGSKFIFTLKK